METKGCYCFFLKFLYSFLLILCINALCTLAFDAENTSIAMWFVLQLQYRGLREKPSTPLLCPPCGIGNGNRYRKYSQVKFNRLKASCKVSTNHANSGKDFRISHSALGGSRCAFHLTPGFLGCVAPINAVIYGSVKCGFRRALANCGSFAWRSFSQDASLTNRYENIGVCGTEGGGNTLGFQAFNEHRKQPKSLAAHKKKKAESSNISASKDADTMDSSEQVVGDGKDDVKLGSSISTTTVINDDENTVIDGQQKQRSGSKKNKVQQFAPNASGESIVAKGPKSSFQAKRSSASKKGKKSTLALEVSSY